MNANFAASRAATRRMRLGLFLVVIGVPTACQKSDSIPTTADRLKSVEQRQQTVPDFYVPRKAVDYMSDLKSIKENAAKPAAPIAATPAVRPVSQATTPVEAPPKVADAKPIIAAAPPPVTASPAPTPVAPAPNIVANAQPTARPPPPKEVASTLTVVSREQPQFPKEAARSGVESGRVRAKMVIDAAGGVSSVVIVEATPSRVFDRSVSQALSRWKFNPGAEGRTYETEINFKL